jgi:nitroimidazol reductase NimA-like FMN-containing flavoprotein (pyridoxamine 5'-phosphate oxidase superfamily)
MRRTDREIRDRGVIEDILGSCTVMHLGLCCDGLPYVVPVSYGYHEGSLCFHGAPSGMKLDFMRSNGVVCFQVDTDRELVEAREPSGYDMRYRSVTGWGRAFLIEDEAEKAKALDILMRRHGGPEGPYPADALGRVALVRVDIDRMTGKHGSER